jgi:hypothetical protein
LYGGQEQLNERDLAIFYYEVIARWVRKEKQENKTGENLSLGSRRIELLNARKKSLPEWKDKSQDRLRKNTA